MRVRGHYTVNRAIKANGRTVATYTYMGDGLKRQELVNGTPTTIVWDGTNSWKGGVKQWE